MADDVTLPGTGAVVAADEIASVKYQRTKLVWGVDGSAVDASASNPLPVVQTGTPAGVAGDVAHDTADSGNPVKIGGKAVDPEAMPADVAVGDRVNLALTPKGVVAVTLFEVGGAPLGTVPVSFMGDLPAGDNNIGNVDVVTLPALVAGSANIGDVDVLTVPADPFGANADAAVAAGAAGSQSAKLRRLTTDIDAIKTSVAAATPAGSNNIGDVDVLTLPALVAGSANIGDVDIASIAAGDNNIGNVDIVTLPALVAGSAAIGKLAANAGVNIGNIGNPPHFGLIADPYSLVHEAAQYTTAQTSTVLVAGGASEKIVVTKVQIQVGGTVAGTLQLYFGTGAFARGTNRAIFDGEFAPSATSKPGVVMDGPFIAGTNGDDLMVTGVGAINPLTINVWYYVVT